MLAEPARQALLEFLAEARLQHFVGPGPVAAQVEHSLGFAALIAEPPGRAVDLGSGAGLPGLVLALLWPGSSWTLLDANARRTAFVRQSLPALGLDDRVEVVTDRAESVARQPHLRGAADVVVARGFGPPAVVAECGAPLVRMGGILVVAEPPGGAPGRWPAPGLALLGLAEDGSTALPVALQRLRQVAVCPDRYPRRVGIPQKRPLF